MSDYQQPDFYRFNEDSFRLVEYVRKTVSTAWNILDAGAGCGVIGLELGKHLKAQSLTLLELQEEFRPFLEENAQRFSTPPLKTDVVISSFSLWKPSRPYDLIVSNPPYYLPGHGESSLDPQRDLARSFKKDGWRPLLELTLASLAPRGKGFFVVKNNKNLLHEIHHYLPIGLRCSEHSDKDLVFVELVRLNED